MRAERAVKIREFLINNIPEHPGNIVKLCAEHLGVSTETVRSYIKKLVQEGVVVSAGKTKGITYSLRLHSKSLSLQVTAGMSESDVWDGDIAPFLPEMRENIRAICNYAFSEMLNNVIDHSGALTVYIKVEYDARDVRFRLIDSGVGIFDKIMAAKNLANKEDAILALHKGKLTTDPDHHSGEGIFFTSRTMDDFNILSGGLLFHGHEDDDWLYMAELVGQKGTSVFMRLSRNADTLIEEVFETYTSENKDGIMGFDKTEVLVPLYKKGGSSLVSRSQAKRLVTRLDNFNEVILNFAGVKWMGQAFADEVFRVFQRRHPDILLTPVNANSRVLNMIAHVTGGTLQRDLFDQTE